MDLAKLTTKQRLFVEAYLVNPNGAEAARSAGYKGKPESLRVVANENLRKPAIRNLIETRISAVAMTAQEVLFELGTIARGEYSTYKSDKLKALELLGKHHQLFRENPAHDQGHLLAKAVQAFALWNEKNPYVGVVEIEDAIQTIAKGCRIERMQLESRLESEGLLNKT
jgi:phage terminase small subunit